MQNTEEKEELLEIPDEVVVECPLKGYALLPVAKCTGCPKFGGFDDRFPESREPFQVRYVHKCWGAPVKRTMRVMAKG